MSERRIEYRRGASPEILADLPDGWASLVLTDPPYGTGSEAAIYGRRRDGKANAIANDRDLSALKATLPEIRRLLAPGGVALLCCAPSLRRTAEEFVEQAGLAPLHVIVWDKGAPGISYRVRYAHEDVVVAAHPGVDPWDTREPIISPLRIGRVREPRHPNEKPVALFRALIRWAGVGRVLDPFAGIASCGVAAVLEGCEYVGVELDPAWWSLGESRIAHALGQPIGTDAPNLFDGTEAA